MYNQSTTSEIKKEKITLEKKEYVSSRNEKYTLEDFIKGEVFENSSLNQKIVNEHIKSTEDSVKESIIASIMNTDSMIQSFDNKVKDLEEKEKVVMFKQLEQKEIYDFVPLELDENELLPFGSEDDVIKTEEEDEKIFLSLDR